MIYAIILVASAGAVCIGWGWLLSDKPASLGVSQADNASSAAMLALIGAILLLLAVGLALWAYL